MAGEPMSDDLSAILGRMRGRHVLAIRAAGMTLRCSGCGDAWPCDASRLLAVAEAAAERRRFYRALDADPFNVALARTYTDAVEAEHAVLDALAASTPDDSP